MCKYSPPWFFFSTPTNRTIHNVFDEMPIDVLVWSELDASTFLRHTKNNLPCGVMCMFCGWSSHVFCVIVQVFRWFHVPVKILGRNNSVFEIYLIVCALWNTWPGLWKMLATTSRMVKIQVQLSIRWCYHPDPNNKTTSRFWLLQRNNLHCSQNIKLKCF